MSKDFASLMAQVLPVILLALIVQVGPVITRLRSKSARQLAELEKLTAEGVSATFEQRDKLGTTELQIALYLLSNVAVILLLAIAETICVLSLVNTSVPPFASRLVVSVMMLSLVLLVLVPIGEWFLLVGERSRRTTIKLALSLLLPVVAVLPWLLFRF